MGADFSYGDEGLEKEAQASAGELRTRLQLGDNPIRDIESIIESYATVDIARMDMPVGVDGMLVFDPETNRSVIGIATTRIPFRQLFTLAHELGHIHFKDYTSGIHEGCQKGQEDNSVERRADNFARHFLIPENAVSSFLENTSLTTSVFPREYVSNLVRTFRVSPQVAMIQMRACGWITPEQWEEYKNDVTAYSLAEEFEWLEEYEELAFKSNNPQMPKEMERRAVEGYRRNILSLSRLAVYYGLEVDEMPDVLDVDGVFRDEEPELIYGDVDKLLNSSKSVKNDP